MSALPLLIVAVMGAGGPRHSHPVRVADAVVTISRDHKPVATSSVGNLALRLPPSTYTVQASLTPGHPCEVRTVHLAPKRARQVLLHCPIK
jgi:hypothetical protein